MIIVRQLREELTQALVEHLHQSGVERFRKQYPFMNPFPDELSLSRNLMWLEDIARDCMDFMYGEIEELYPDQPSCDGQSEESAPVPDHQE